MKIEVGKAYRMRNGGKCEIVADLGNTGHPWLGVWRCSSPTNDGAAIQLTREGSFHSAGASPLDIIDEWREPRKGERWVNVYSTGLGVFHYPTREDVDKIAGADRIGRVRVEWTEGQFDE